MHLVRAVNDLTFIDELELVRPGLMIVNFLILTQRYAEHKKSVLGVQLLPFASRNLLRMAWARGH